MSVSEYLKCFAFGRKKMGFSLFIAYDSANFAVKFI